MATGSPFGSDRNGMEAKPEIRIRIREIRFFRNFFFAFFGFYGLLGPQGHPPDAPEPPNPDPDPGNPVFPENFFSPFLASTDLLGPQGHPRMDRNHLIRIRTGKSGFFENPDFSFFRLFKLKDPTIWVSMDSPGPT